MRGDREDFLCGCPYGTRVEVDLMTLGCFLDGDIFPEPLTEPAGGLSSVCFQLSAAFEKVQLLSFAEEAVFRRGYCGLRCGRRRSWSCCER